MRNSRLLIIFASAVLALIASTAEAPKLLPFQGHLTDASGTPLPDGAQLIQFRIYDAPVAGSAVWAGEVHRTTVNGGLVNVILGAKASLDLVDFDRALYLEIAVDIDGDSAITAADPPLLPRQVLLPVLLAKESLISHDSYKLAGFDWSALLDADNPVTGRIAGTRIVPETISSLQIADGAVGVGELQNGAVSTAKLQDAAVETSKIAAGAVTGDHIASGAVGFAQIAPVVINTLAPPGSVTAFAGPNAPAGWLLCDGAPVSRIQYAHLFASIGTAWGTGDGSTTFNLPDMRGLFLRGVDASAGRDADTSTRTPLRSGANRGPNVGSYQGDEFRTHQHVFGGTATLPALGYAEVPGTALTQNASHSGTGSRNYFTKASPNTPGGTETRPKNVYVNYIIKY